MSDLNLSFERKHWWTGGSSFLLLFGFCCRPGFFPGWGFQPEWILIPAAYRTGTVTELKNRKNRKLNHDQYRVPDETRYWISHGIEPWVSAFECQPRQFWKKGPILSRIRNRCVFNAPFDSPTKKHWCSGKLPWNARVHSRWSRSTERLRKSLPENTASMNFRDIFFFRMGRRWEK